MRPADPTTGRARRAARGAAPDPRRRRPRRSPIIWTIFSPLMILPFLVRGRPRRGAGPRPLGAPRDRGRVRRHGGDARRLRARLPRRRRRRALLRHQHGDTRPHQRRGVPALAAAVGPACPGGGGERRPSICSTSAGAISTSTSSPTIPVTAYSWALAPGNPDLDTVHVRTGRAVVGGLPAKPEIASMTADGPRGARAGAPSTR